jgi:hypothetical protein
LSSPQYFDGIMGKTLRLMMGNPMRYTVEGNNENES